MGVRVISGASSFSLAAPVRNTSFGPKGVPGGRHNVRRLNVPRFTLLFDGTAGQQGLASALPANMAWLDPTTLVRLSMTQLSLTAVYNGAGTCKVYGAMLPSEYSVRVENSDGAALVTEASSKFQLITTLNPNVAANLITNGIAYTLYQFEFLTTVQPGNVVVTGL